MAAIAPQCYAENDSKPIFEGFCPLDANSPNQQGMDIR